MKFIMMINICVVLKMLFILQIIVIKVKISMIKRKKIFVVLINLMNIKITKL
jgi:hypothetical protein